MSNKNCFPSCVLWYVHDPRRIRNITPAMVASPKWSIARKRIDISTCILHFIKQRLEFQMKSETQQKTIQGRMLLSQSQPRRHHHHRHRHLEVAASRRLAAIVIVMMRRKTKWHSHSNTRSMGIRSCNAFTRRTAAWKPWKGRSSAMRQN